MSVGTDGDGIGLTSFNVDKYGRVILGSDKTIIYPPTTAGTAGQVWTSDGSGVGYWSDPGPKSPFLTDVGGDAYIGYHSDSSEVEGEIYSWGVYGEVNVVWSASPSIPDDVTGILTVNGTGVERTSKVSSGTTVSSTHEVDFGNTATLSNSKLKSGKFTSIGHKIASRNMSNDVLLSASVSITITLSDGSSASGSFQYTRG